MIPRWCHRLFAFVRGYYWKPCPRCGRMYGGHEAQGSMYAYTDNTSTPGHSFRVNWSTCCPPHDYAEVRSNSDPRPLLELAYKALDAIQRLGYPLDPNWPKEADEAYERIGQLLWPDLSDIDGKEASRGDEG